jgi:broad-specificity NMP kinase
MTTHILGAPGAGKTTLAAPLREAMPDYVVVDWDAFVAPASALAGRDIRESPATWPAYRQLVRAVVDELAGTPLVILGVCTPDELAGWPIDSWLLVDCSDRERRARLSERMTPAQVDAALLDAARYRSLGLRTVDTTGRSPADVSEDLAAMVRSRA